MKEQKKQILGHVLACGTQMMWGATFVSTKVLLAYFLPVQVLFTRVVIAFLMLWILYPHSLKIVDKKRELAFAGAGLFGIVLYFMLENTALTMTYASNVGIIVACAPFFVAVIVGIFFKNEKPGVNFFIGFVIAIIGIAMISMNGAKSLHLNPKGDMLAFTAMISWGCYSAVIKKIGQKVSWDMTQFQRPEIILNFLFLGVGASAMGFFLWNLSTKWIGAIKTSVYIYVSPVVTVVLSVVILHEKMTVVSVSGAVLILLGLIVSQKKRNFVKK